MALDINSVQSSSIPGHFEDILHAERVEIIENDLINANLYCLLSSLRRRCLRLLFSTSVSTDTTRLFFRRCVCFFSLCSGCLVIPVARELVLDYIVERKRMDDLCGSIIDGRFREQKVPPPIA